MGRLRFSIASLLGVVLFVAVGVAALREATDGWDSGLFGMTLLALLVGVLLAASRPGDRRPFWVGFTLFGWAYLVASLIPTVEARLPTTKGLAYLDSKIPGRSLYADLDSSGTTFTVRNLAVSPEHRGGTVRIWKIGAGSNGTTDNFLRIGHSLLALVMAFAGGHLARHLATREGVDGPRGGGIPEPICSRPSMHVAVDDLDVLITYATVMTVLEAKEQGMVAVNDHPV
jgi:hypothetical protein